MSHPECSSEVIAGVLVGDQWTANGPLLEVFNPSTEQRLAVVSTGDGEAVELAVKSALRAFGSWSKSTGAFRGEVLRRIADSVRQNRQALMTLQSRNNGKPLAEASLDVDDVIATFDYYADLAQGLDDAQDRGVPLPSSEFTARLRREPCGVVALIVPWNFPMVTTAWKLAPALAAGCTVVLKPSEVTPLAELELARLILEAGLPAGVLNVVCGTGIAVGAPLASHPKVAKISFTGSNAVGTQVMQRAAETVKGVSLELGGKSSLIVLAQADLDLAVELTCSGGFFNAGQMCSATSRVLVSEQLMDAFVDKVKARAQAIVVGDPFTEAVQMGPLVSRAQYQRVLEHIARGLASGARLECGGKRPEGLERGFFIAPTVFTEVSLHSSLWNEEIFGPVLCIRRFNSEAEAVALANQTDFGLVATVVSNDLEAANRVADALEAGMVWVNSPQVIFPQTAWGGYKQSSIGRELGPWGLMSFQELKHVVVAA